MSLISEPVPLSYNLDAVLWFMDVVLRKKKYLNQEDYIKDCREILDIAERNWLFEWEEPEDNEITYADSPKHEICADS
jgi:hypothetical protein